MKPSANLAIQGIKHILEFSADAHIQRRAVARDCPAFHSLTGKIAAFGKVFTFLAPHEQEKTYLAKGQERFHQAAAQVNSRIAGREYKFIRGL